MEDHMATVPRAREKEYSPPPANGDVQARFWHPPLAVD